MSFTHITIGLLTGFVAGQVTISAPQSSYSWNSDAQNCDPARAYPAGTTCDDSGPTPTLVYGPTSFTTATPPAAIFTDGVYICNPSYSYRSATCTGDGATPAISYYAPINGTLETAAYTNTTLATSAITNSTFGTSDITSTTTLTSDVITTTLDTSDATSTMTAMDETTSSSDEISDLSSILPATSDGTSSTSTINDVVSTTLETSVVASTSLARRSFVKPIQAASRKIESCPLDLGEIAFEFPHLIVWSYNGQTTSETQYNGKVNPNLTSYYNFDVPSYYAGKTCDLVFSLPRQDQLETSTFTLSGNGTLNFSSLQYPAAENAKVPGVSTRLAYWSPTPGYQITVTSGRCAAGTTIGYSISATGGTSLQYFQDYNPCAIGLYILAY